MKNLIQKLIFLWNSALRSIRKKEYSSLIGLKHLKRATKSGLVTDNPNEALFYLPHQIIELCWMNMETILVSIQKNYKKGNLMPNDLHTKLLKLISLQNYSNRTLAMMKSILTKDEFLNIRNSFGNASGFQSGYRRLEIMIAGKTRLEISHEGSTSKCPFSKMYWQKSGVSKKAIEEMIQALKLTQLEKAWRNDNLSSIVEMSFGSYPQIINAMLKLEKQVGEGFKSQHKLLADHYLHELTQGTGGSAYKTYLNESMNYRLINYKSINLN